MTNRAHLPGGTVLSNRYEILETMGEGGFSITYRARHRDMDRIVAIKEFFCRDYMYRDVTVSDHVRLSYEPAYAQEQPEAGQGRQGAYDGEQPGDAQGWQGAYDGAQPGFMQGRQAYDGAQSRDAQVQAKPDPEAPEQARKQLAHDLQHFLQEARILAGLSGMPGIVRVTDYFKENDTAYIVMDMVQGISLQSMLDRHVLFSWEEVLKSFLPLIRSLSLVHKKGLIHRDIKPDNLMVGEDGSLTLIDFGAAIRFGGDETHSVFLSEGYAPKEQYLRNGRQGPYTDVYALCAVIYHCLTGITCEGSLQRSVFDELKRPSAVGTILPPGFEEVLMKGLALEPEDRWQTMDELGKALEAFLPKPARSRKGFYIAAGLVMAAAAAGAVYTITNYTRLRMRYLLSKGEAVTVHLEAPDQMKAGEFEQACMRISERANAFCSGRNYWLETGPGSMDLVIPKKYLEMGKEDSGESAESGSSSLASGAGSMDTDSLLSTCFSFDGVWRVLLSEQMETGEYTSDDQVYAQIDCSNFDQVELKNGSVPGREDGWYLEMKFNEEMAGKLQDFLDEEGENVTAVGSVWDGVIQTQWAAAGDGRTVYWPVGSSSCENVAHALQQIMVSEPVSDSLALSWEDAALQKKIAWETPEEGTAQCRPEDFSVPTVELAYDAGSDSSADSIAATCRKRMQTLGLPYAIGRREQTVYLRLPSDQMTKLLLASFTEGTFSIRSPWNVIEDMTYVDDVQARVAENYRLTLHINSFGAGLLDEFLEGLGETDVEGEVLEQTGLFLGGWKIGTFAYADVDEGSFTFDLLLPDDDADTRVPAQTMMQYLCALMTGDQEPLITDTVVWRDAQGHLTGAADDESLPENLDLSRFEPLFTEASLLGARTGYGSEASGKGDQITITFDNWAGDFPNGALELAEALYEGSLIENVCSSARIEFYSWYQGYPVTLGIYFHSEEASRSMVCTGGSLWMEGYEGGDISENVKEYISASEVLAPTADRFYREDGTAGQEDAGMYSASWTFIRLVT